MAPVFNNPLATPAAPVTPYKRRPTLTVKPGFNAKPNKNANSGAAPGLAGDKQKIVKPAIPQIASARAVGGTPQPSVGAAIAAGAPVAGQSGLDMAMSALADKMHPRGR